MLPPHLVVRLSHAGGLGADQHQDVGPLVGAVGADARVLGRGALIPATMGSANEHEQRDKRQQEVRPIRPRDCSVVGARGSRRARPSSLSSGSWIHPDTSGSAGTDPSRRCVLKWVVGARRGLMRVALLALLFLAAPVVLLAAPAVFLAVAAAFLPDFAGDLSGNHTALVALAFATNEAAHAVHLPLSVTLVDCFSMSIINSSPPTCRWTCPSVQPQVAPDVCRRLPRVSPTGQTGSHVNVAGSGRAEADNSPRTPQRSRWPVPRMRGGPLRVGRVTPAPWPAAQARHRQRRPPGDRLSTACLRLAPGLGSLRTSPREGG